MKHKLLVLLVVLAPFVVHAQTNLSTGAYNCGSTMYPHCIQVPLAESDNGIVNPFGTVWLQWTPSGNASFLLFSGNDGDDISGETSAMSASWVTLVPYGGTTAATFNKNNHYQLVIHSFSGNNDMNGNPFSGSGSIYFHYILVTVSSGRGGGGTGLKLVVEPGGKITLN